MTRRPDAAPPGHRMGRPPGPPSEQLNLRIDSRLVRALHEVAAHRRLALTRVVSEYLRDGLVRSGVRDEDLRDRLLPALAGDQGRGRR